MIPATATATATELQPDGGGFTTKIPRIRLFLWPLWPMILANPTSPAAGCLSYEFARLIELWHTERE